MSAPATVDVPKLARLLGMEDDAKAAAHAAAVRVTEARDARQQLEVELERITRHGQRYGERSQPTDAPGRREIVPVDFGKAVVAKLEVARAALARAQADAERLQAVWQPRGQLADALRQFATAAGVDVKRLPAYAPPRQALAHAPLPSPDAVTQARARIKQLRRELARLRRAPATQAEVFGAIDAAIARSAGAVRFGALPRPGDPAARLNLFDAPAEPLPDVPLHHVQSSLQAQTESLLAALVPDRLRDILRREAVARAEAAGGFGLDAQARAAAIANATAELFDFERDEERLIATLESHGFVVERRGDADPKAVLWLDTAEPSRPSNARRRQRSAYVDHATVARESV